MFTSKNAMMSILSVLVVLSLGFGVLTAQAEEMKQGKVIGKKQAKDDGMGMIAIPGKNYEMSKYEVTQGQWQAIMGSNPSYFKSCGENCPVDQVSWNDIQEFLQKLNAKTGKQYRLPSEAEWEYACYGGSQTEYCGGNDLNSVAWNRDNSNKTTHPVGQKQANGFGLYDMSGNVQEYMSDCYKINCKGRVKRGRSWSDFDKYARAAMRDEGIPERGAPEDGFRLARTLP